MRGSTQLALRVADARTLASKVAVMHREMQDGWRVVLAPWSMSLPRYEILRAVAASEPLPRVTDLAEGLGLHRTSVRGLLDVLGRQGLVETRQDPADRRCLRVKMSELGMQMIREIDEAVSDSVLVVNGPSAELLMLAAKGR